MHLSLKLKLLSRLTIDYTGKILFGIIKQLFRTICLLFEGDFELSVDRTFVWLYVLFISERGILRFYDEQKCDIKKSASRFP